MNKLLKGIDSFLYDDFIFSSRYKVLRHIVYWLFLMFIWAVFWMIMGMSDGSFGPNLFNMVFWLPQFILFGYPLAYWAIPHLFLKGKVAQFFLVSFAWGAAGMYINAGYKNYFFVPTLEALGVPCNIGKGLQPHSYLCMTTSAASTLLIKFFKLWIVKQRDWMHAQQEKITAELKLLKSQVHPHFLFNTLNNIYSFSLENSPKTPDMILKLSSLISYMLNECKAEEVRLEKEIAIISNYIDLEKERYGNKIEIAWSVEGNIRDKFISPLLMLPLVENAFKHGTSEQVEKPWLSVDISVESDVLHFKIANSKNKYVLHHTNGNGIGIHNVKKRLELMYPDSHELKMRDEETFFAVSLRVNLTGYISHKIPVPFSQPVVAEIIPA